MEEYACDHHVDKPNLYTMEGLCFIVKYVPKVLDWKNFHRNKQTSKQTKFKHTRDKSYHRLILTCSQKINSVYLAFEKLHLGLLTVSYKSRFQKYFSSI